jgi:hypothetical protein
MGTETILAILLPYVLAFCRVVIGLVFSISCISKAVHTGHFERTIAQLAIIPSKFSKVAAVSVLSSECIVVVLMFIGGRLLLHGFVITIFLLLFFCVVLTTVLIRKMRVPCNCFGSTAKSISRYDLWRNACFFMCALVGYAVLTGPYSGTAYLEAVEWGPIVLVAAVIVVTWIRISEFVLLFRLILPRGSIVWSLLDRRTPRGREALVRTCDHDATVGSDVTRVNRIID